MKLDQILNENELDEIAFTKKGKAKKAASKAVNQEVGELKIQLAAWMKGSGLKQITAGDMIDFLQQKGLGAPARSIVGKMTPKSELKVAKKAAQQANKQQAQAQWNRSAGLPAESIEEAKDDSVLTKREVDAILKQAVQAGYKGSAQFDKSRFAGKGGDGAAFSSTRTPADKQPSKDDIRTMIQTLRQAGYKVTQ